MSVVSINKSIHQNIFILIDRLGGSIKKKVAQNRVKPKQDKMLEYEKKTQIRNIFKMYDVNQMVCKSLTNLFEI